MTALSKLFQDHRAYVTEWFRFPDGTVQSFRFHRDRYQEMRSAVIRRGGVRITDPFRKGAPLGGYSDNRECA